MRSNRSSAARLLVAEIAGITAMERGKLTEEYRTGSSPDGGPPVRLGPYYKHQVWEGGRNVSRRVPATGVAALREALANHERFRALAADFAEQSIARTRALRRAVRG